MTLFSPNSTRQENCCPQDVPGWVNDQINQFVENEDDMTDPICSDDGRWSLSRVVIKGADALDDKALEQQTTQAYMRALTALKSSSAPHPVRGWNVIPAIDRSPREGYDRYMSFNTGRHKAYCQYFKGTQAFKTGLPTASAVGHDGADLSIVLLGYQEPGRAIENPRQVPAFRYSSRYGPTPPSFVRATVLPPEAGPNQILVAGTASVVGEDSRHADDLEKQVQETFHNLAAVLYTVDGLSTEIDTMPRERLLSVLTRYRSARVYVRRADDMQRVCQTIQQTLTGLESIELVRADICRPDLLVEVEGVAVMSDGADE